jgi:type II secretory pathway component PulF
MVLVHGAVGGLFLFLMCVLAPRLAVVGRDFNIHLPAAFELVLAASLWLANQPYLVPLTVIVLAADGVLLGVLRHRLGATSLARVWFVLVTLAVGVACVGLVIALWLPLTKVLEGLSK